MNKQFRLCREVFHDDLGRYRGRCNLTKCQSQTTDTAKQRTSVEGNVEIEYCSFSARKYLLRVDYDYIAPGTHENGLQASAINGLYRALSACPQLTNSTYLSKCLAELKPIYKGVAAGLVRGSWIDYARETTCLDRENSNVERIGSTQNSMSRKQESIMLHIIMQDDQGGQPRVTNLMLTPDESGRFHPSTEIAPECLEEQRVSRNPTYLSINSSPGNDVSSLHVESNRQRSSSMGSDTATGTSAQSSISWSNFQNDMDQVEDHVQPFQVGHGYSMARSSSPAASRVSQDFESNRESQLRLCPRRSTPVIKKKLTCKCMDPCKAAEPGNPAEACVSVPIRYPGLRNHGLKPLPISINTWRPTELVPRSEVECPPGYSMGTISATRKTICQTRGASQCQQTPSNTLMDSIAGLRRGSFAAARCELASRATGSLTSTCSRKCSSAAEEPTQCVAPSKCIRKRKPTGYVPYNPTTETERESSYRPSNTRSSSSMRVKSVIIDGLEFGSSQSSAVNAAYEACPAGSQMQSHPTSIKNDMNTQQPPSEMKNVAISFNQAPSRGDSVCPPPSVAGASQIVEPISRTFSPSKATESREGMSSVSVYISESRPQSPAQHSLHPTSLMQPCSDEIRGNTTVFSPPIRTPSQQNCENRPSNESTWIPQMTPTINSVNLGSIYNSSQLSTLACEQQLPSLYNPASYVSGQECTQPALPIDKVLSSQIYPQMMSSGLYSNASPFSIAPSSHYLTAAPPSNNGTQQFTSPLKNLSVRLPACSVNPNSVMVNGSLCVNGINFGLLTPEQPYPCSTAPSVQNVSPKRQSTTGTRCPPTIVVDQHQQQLGIEMRRCSSQNFELYDKNNGSFLTDDPDQLASPRNYEELVGFGNCRADSHCGKKIIKHCTISDENEGNLFTSFNNGATNDGLGRREYISGSKHLDMCSPETPGIHLSQRIEKIVLKDRAEICAGLLCSQPHCPSAGESLQSSLCVTSCQNSHQHQKRNLPFSTTDAHANSLVPCLNQCNQVTHQMIERAYSALQSDEEPDEYSDCREPPAFIQTPSKCDCCEVLALDEEWPTRIKCSSCPPEAFPNDFSQIPASKDLCTCQPNTSEIKRSSCTVEFDGRFQWSGTPKTGLRNPQCTCPTELGARVLHRSVSTSMVPEVSTNPPALYSFLSTALDDGYAEKPDSGPTQLEASVKHSQPNPCIEQKIALGKEPPQESIATAVVPEYPANPCPTTLSQIPGASVIAAEPPTCSVYYAPINPPCVYSAVAPNSSLPFHDNQIFSQQMYFGYGPLTLVSRSAIRGMDSDAKVVQMLNQKSAGEQETFVEPMTSVPRMPGAQSTQQELGDCAATEISGLPPWATAVLATRVTHRGTSMDDCNEESDKQLAPDRITSTSCICEPKPCDCSPINLNVNICMPPVECPNPFIGKPPCPTEVRSPSPCSLHHSCDAEHCLHYYFCCPTETADKCCYDHRPECDPQPPNASADWRERCGSKGIQNRQQPAASGLPPRKGCQSTTQLVQESSPSITADNESSQPPTEKPKCPNTENPSSLSAGAVRHMGMHDVLTLIPPEDRKPDKLPDDVPCDCKHFHNSAGGSHRVARKSTADAACCRKSWKSRPCPKPETERLNFCGTPAILLDQAFARAKCVEKRLIAGRVANKRLFSGRQWAGFRNQATK